MQKENEQNSNPKVDANIKNWEVSQDLINFLYNHKSEEIEENYKNLIFWQQALLETDLMDDPENRKEFQRIVDMQKALTEIANKFKNEEIVKLLQFVADGRAITYRILNPLKKHSKRKSFEKKN